MALVAYSDESDMSDTEDAESSPTHLSTSVSDGPALKNSGAGVAKGSAASTDAAVDGSNAGANGRTAEASCSSIGVTNGSAAVGTGVATIVDDDDDFIVPGDSNIISGRKFLSTLPAVSKATRVNSPLDGLEDDLTDVPTKDTWKVSKEVLQRVSFETTMEQ